jgi:opacity protein-like surface antigen
VPSWYFGDGAQLLGQVASSFRVGQIAPLDSVLESPFVQRSSGGSLGIRVARSLTRRVDAEFSLDYHAGTLAITSVSAAGIEAARAGFVTAWNAVLSGPSRGTQSVSSVARIADRRGSQAVTAGALIINMRPAARLSPYVTVGAGFRSNRGGTPTAVLVGDYRFGLVLPPGVPVPAPLPQFHETDTVTVRPSVDHAVGAIVGGGVKYAVSDRWGVRFDVRDHIVGNTMSTTVDAEPASTVLTPNTLLTISILNNPALQFSTNSTTPSSLSSPLAGFTTFRGTGIDHHVSAAAGVFWRF